MAGVQGFFGDRIHGAVREQRTVKECVRAVSTSVMVRTPFCSAELTRLRSSAGEVPPITCVRVRGKGRVESWGWGWGRGRGWGWGWGWGQHAC
jgi:hypothetical protein